MNKRIFGEKIPIITEEEYNDEESLVRRLRKDGNTVAHLQIMYHLATHMTDESGMTVLGFESMMLGEKKDIEKYIEYSLAVQALDEIFDAAKESLAKADEQKSEEFYKNPVFTDSGEVPNAVLVKTDGTAAVIRLKGFISGDDLGEPLDCSSTDMVLNKIPIWAMKNFKLKLAGYVDGGGIPKGLPENEAVQRISGCDHIAGGCVIVGIDMKHNYIPLNPRDAVKIAAYFNG